MKKKAMETHRGHDDTPPKEYVVKRPLISPQKLDTVDKCRDFIAERMYNAGYSQRDVRMFLAGATWIGFLQQGASKWARVFQIQKHFSHLDPMDKDLDAAGDHKEQY